MKSWIRVAVIIEVGKIDVSTGSGRWRESTKEEVRLELKKKKGQGLGSKKHQKEKFSNEQVATKYQLAVGTVLGIEENKRC